MAKAVFLSLPFLLCVLLYCAFVGFEIPALRTLLICVIVTFTLLLRQSVQPLKLLILSAALLLLLILLVFYRPHSGCLMGPVLSCCESTKPFSNNRVRQYKQHYNDCILQ